MNIRDNVEKIVKTNSTKDFTNLVNHLKFTQCKTEAEIRSILASNGLPPNLFDELKTNSNPKTDL
jgi:hypothetical protein